MSRTGPGSRRTTRWRGTRTRTSRQCRSPRATVELPAVRHNAFVASARRQVGGPVRRDPFGKGQGLVPQVEHARVRPPVSRRRSAPPGRRRPRHRILARRHHSGRGINGAPELPAVILLEPVADARRGRAGQRSHSRRGCAGAPRPVPPRPGRRSRRSPRWAPAATWRAMIALDRWS